MKKNEWRREISKSAANNRQKAKRANASQKKDGAFAARRYEQGKTTQAIFFEISTSRNGMDTHGNAVWATYISIASGLSNQLGHVSGSTWFEQEGGGAHIHGSSKILELPVSSGTWGFKTQTDVDLISMLLRKQGSEDTNLLSIYTYISAYLCRPLPICQRKRKRDDSYERKKAERSESKWRSMVALFHMPKKKGKRGRFPMKAKIRKVYPNLEKHREYGAGLSNPAPIKKIGGAWMSLAMRCVSL